jgi:hypothetical protein
MGTPASGSGAGHRVHGNDRSSAKLARLSTRSRRDLVGPYALPRGGKDGARREFLRRDRLAPEHPSNTDSRSINEYRDPSWLVSRVSRYSFGRGNSRSRGAEGRDPIGSANTASGLRRVCRRSRSCTRDLSCEVRGRVQRGPDNAFVQRFFPRESYES